MSILQKHRGPRIMSQQGCPGGFGPTLTQIIEGQMQLTIGLLQLGRTYFIWGL